MKEKIARLEAEGAELKEKILRLKRQNHGKLNVIIKHLSNSLDLSYFFPQYLKGGGVRTMISNVLQLL